MSTTVSIFPGIKSLFLSTDTPYDAIETTRIRNDLCGIKVWYSTQDGFHPENSEGILAFNGLSSNITISGLLPNQQYYVRWAFISSIDPDVFTISEQMTEVTYDETVTVYGHLTNPGTILPVNADGTGGNYSVAGGTYKVYSLSTEVTGQGVTYSILSSATAGGLQVTINATTGVYSVTGQTEDYAAAILSATYNGVTIETTLTVIRARKGIDGTTAKLLSISAKPGNNFVFDNTQALTSNTASVTLTATTQNFSAIANWTAKAYNKDGTLLGNIAFTSDNSTNSITITNSQFSPTGYSNNVSYVLVTAAYETYNDSMTLYRLNNGTDQLTFELSNQAHTIPAYYDGTVVPSGYIGSGTELKVYEGNIPLAVATITPMLKGQWNVSSATGNHITPDTSVQLYTPDSNTITYDTHTNMTADAAYIDYTVLVKTRAGVEATITKRQSFAKSIGGTPGYTATLAFLTTTELVFIKYKDGTYSSDYVTIYADTQNIPDPKKYEWDDGSGTIITKHSTTAGANEFRFNRPTTGPGVSTIKVTVTCENTALGLNPANDAISIASIEEGSDAYNFIFKDPYVFLSANSLGIVESGVTSIINHIIGAKGMALLTPNTDIVYTIDSTENCVASIGSITGTWNQQFTITGTTGNSIFTNASVNTAKVVIKCQIPGGTYFLQTCYITKVSKGDTGTAGTNAFLADLVSEADVTTTLSDGTGYTLPTGNALRLYSGGTALTSGVTYGGGITKNGLTLAINSSGVITLSGTSWTSDTETFNITAIYNSITYNAAYTIAKSKAGSDAVFVDLLSETEIVSTASDGTGYTLPTGNSMRLFKGGVQITTGVVYSGGIPQNGLTLAINSSTGAITLTGASWTSTQETFTLTATYNSTAYTYRYKIAKSKSGVNGNPGTNARSVDLTTASQAFAYTSAGITPSPASSIVTATGQNTTGIVYYEFLVNATSVQNTTTNTYTYTPSAAFSSMPQIITVKLREGTNTSTILATDIMSMVAIKPGADGTNGVNAISGFLTNESSTVTTANDGSGGSYTNAGGTFKVYNGITDVTGSATYSVVSSSGVTISIAASGIYIVTATNADQGTATLRAVYGGVTIDKIYDISRAKTGAAGASITGATGPKSTSGYIYYSTSTATNPGTPTASSFTFSDGSFSGLTSGWGTTITMTGNGTYWATRYTVTESSSGSNTGTPSFSYPYTHTNFSGLVTFTNLNSYATTSSLASYATTGYVNSTFATPNYADTTAYNNSTYYANQYAAAVKAGLATQGYTAINGGNISTGTLSVDKIQTNSLNGQNAVYGGYNQFGFGTGTIAGGTIATVGYFSTTDPGTLGLGVLSANNTAFVASTVWSGYAGGFGNRYGYGMNDVATGNNLTIAQFASYNTAGYFYHRDTGHTVNLSTDSYALQATGPATISGALSVGSLTVGGVTINTNGGASGYGAGSAPYFGAINASGTITSTNLYGIQFIAGDYTYQNCQGINFGGVGFWTNQNMYCQGTYVGSSIRFKENVLPIDIGLNFILSLEPVKFDLKSNKESKVGFIAEDFPDSRFIFDGFIDPTDPSKGKQITGIDYTTIVAPLVKAVQELNAKILELTSQIEILKAK